MYSWISLIPTALVLLLACLTHNINKALAGGILCAALLASKGDAITALSSILTRFYDHLSDGDNIALYLFLIIVSSLITLFLQTNSVYAVAQQVAHKIRTKKSAEYTSFITSLFLSIDDYLSILTTGFMMRPLSDQLAIAPTRLAFIVHSLAGPLVILSPLSSWVAAILLQLDQSGVHTVARENSMIISDPFFMYLNMTPYLFYPLLTVFTVWYVITRQLSYEKTSLQGQKKHQLDIIPGNHSVIDILLPIIVLLVTVIVGFLYSGGYSLFNDTTILQALQANDATFIIMCLGAFVSFTLAYITALHKKNISLEHLPTVLVNGFILIKGAVIMVMLASIFGVFVKNDLHTGAYLADILLGSVQDMFIPLMIFITATLITFATGSAWGTFALLLPIVVEMLTSMQHLTLPTTPEHVYLLLPALGAIFSGAVCGDHLSPFSETTIMTATATGITPLEHTYTQLRYMLPTLCITIMLFLLSGMTHIFTILATPFVLLLIGIVSIILSLGLVNTKK